MMKVCRPKTRSICVSGCEQNCVHCQGLFLGSMSSDIDFETESCLISGGCNKDGIVPFRIMLLKKLKGKGKKINVHPGLVDERRAKEIGKYADAVSFDFVTDNSIIKEKYNLCRTEQDYVDSYLSLKRYCRVVPHIMIGYGNERKSIDILASLEAQEICIIILSSHPKLKNPEPNIDEIEAVLRYARPNFRNISLGCMRPLARKKEIDPIAIRYVDSIVNPWSGLDLSACPVQDSCCCF